MKIKQFLATATIFLMSVINYTTMAQAGTNTLADGNYQLWNQFTGPNKVLALSQDGKIYLADKKENDNTQIWELAADKENYRRLTNKAKGKNFSLDLVNEGNNSNKVRIAATGNFSGQAWLLTPFNNGAYRLTTQWQTDKKSLDVINSGNKDQVHLAASGNYSGQMWQFTPAVTNPATQSTPNATLATSACGITIKYQGYMTPGSIMSENEALVSDNGRYQFRNNGGQYVIEEVMNRNTCQFKKIYDFSLIVTLSPQANSFNGGKRGFSYTKDGDIMYIPNVSLGVFSENPKNPSSHRDSPKVNIVGKSTKLELTNDGILRLVNNSGQVIWTTTSEPSTATPTSTASVTSNNVYDKIMAMKAKYPHGMTWTDDNYDRPGGNTGCYAFSMILMNTAFGDQRTERKYTNFNEIRIGDMVRVNKNTHSMIVIGKDNNQFTFAEGNVGGKIHWGRTMTIAELKNSFDYGLTSYP